MWRLCKLGFRHEPSLMGWAFGLSLVAAVPDALLALWLAVLASALLSQNVTLMIVTAVALPTVFTSAWRPGVERVVEERGASSKRLSRHLFTLATTAAPGKEVRVTGIAPRLLTERRQAWERWYGPIAWTRWQTAAWHTLAWAVFGVGYVGAVVFVAYVLASPPASVLLVLAAGSRLSAYIGATVGEIGFLRGIWMDGSIRLAWLENYAAATSSSGTDKAPARLA